MKDIDKLADSVFTAVKGYVDAGLAKRIGDAVADAVKAIPPGKDGDQGPAGKDGERGAPGIDGKDGAPGEKGDPGDPGKDGKDGRDGVDGNPGADGKPGDHGEKGDPGTPGTDGRDGRDGPPGRDAAQIEILPSVDVERSYPRGTFATWKGGLIRAVRTTDEMPDGDVVKAGWAHIVRGLDVIDVEPLGERGISLTVRCSDGQTKQTQIEFPTMIMRGIWAEGQTYAKSDAVRWDGSLWVAKESTDSRPDEKNPRWELAARRGRDGKDGRKGDMGERGAEGRPGRDLTQLGFDGRKTP
jgi:hypothetical protein